jgi:muramidase (phage lysozyme)
MISNNLKAFLDMIAWSEGTIQIPGSDNGYNVLVGSTVKHPLLFHSYDDHPRVYNESLDSTAAGRYQILKKYYDIYKTRLNLPDFGHDSQDKIALQMIQECRATTLINDGNVIAGIIRTTSRWASLPGNTYQQHQHSITDLVKVYNKFLKGDLV